MQIKDLDWNYLNEHFGWAERTINGRFTDRLDFLYPMDVNEATDKFDENTVSIGFGIINDNDFIETIDMNQECEVDGNCLKFLNGEDHWELRLYEAIPLNVLGENGQSIEGGFCS